MGQYIIFETNSQSLGIGIEKVEKIIEFEEGKKVPEPLPYMMGVIKYDGKILPVIDLNKRLYGKELNKDLDSKIIVVNWEGKFIGIAVEDIAGIETFHEEYESPDEDMEMSKEYVEGFIKLEDDIIIVLNIDKLFDKDQEGFLLDDLNMPGLENGGEAERRENNN